MSKTKSLFKDVVIQLSLVYMGVLALVCIVFSLAIYNFASHEIDDGLRRQVVGFRGAFGRPMIDEQATEDLRKSQSTIAHGNLQTKLFLTNIVVISLGSGVSYWFAKKTLGPIEENVHNQERFTADASHELRTPLAAMKSEVEVGLRDKNLTLDDARAILKSNLEEVDKMHGMINQLLHLARSGELADKNVVDLKPFFKSIASSFGSAAHITVSTKVPTEKIRVHDSIVEHVMRILIDNALKYGGEGVKVTLSAHIVKHMLIVEVNVTGPGIGAEEQDKIFERFYRIDTSRTKQGTSHGHGLGLAIARQLTEKAGGCITLRSELKKGTTFTLRLPCDTMGS